MGNRVAIVQSNYIPWKGYFDLINRVDKLILYDEVQYTKQDWRNRNRIKTTHGVKWLSIPVSRGRGLQEKIRDVTVADRGWARRHWKTLSYNYAKAAYFATYEEIFRDLYARLAAVKYLSQINHDLIVVICDLLGIKTRLSWSTEYESCEGRTEKLIDLCRQAGASEYISGPTARKYLDEHQFDVAGIRLSYMDYSGYPVYRQLFPPFEHRVSVMDLLFNEGPNAHRYMLTF